MNNMDAKHFLNHKLRLVPEGANLRAYSPQGEVLLTNQQTDVAEKLISENFRTVFSHYAATKPEEVHDAILGELCLSIVLHYLYLYNLWRNTYKAKANQPLEFQVSDFANADTYDIIFRFLKRSYPDSGLDLSSRLMGWTLEKTEAYYSEREKFYNK